MEPTLAFDILVPGNYFCDLVFTGLRDFPAHGTEIYADHLHVVPGGVLNTIIALRRLGINVGWAGIIGSDFFSRFIMCMIEEERLDTSLLRHEENALQRVTVALSYPEDRAFITHVDPAPNTTDLTIEALEQVNCRHIHFSGLTVDERIPGVLRQCHDRGMTVSMDCQHRTETLEMPLVRAILEQVDFFMPNASEAKLITRMHELDRAIEILAALSIPHIIIKNGPQGAMARSQGECYEQPAMHFPAIVDTTGAGDVFNAGFLAAYLEGLPVPTCLRWGNYCGGMSTQGAGGTATAPMREQLEAWLARDNA